jgi:hypothetical protein
MKKTIAEATEFLRNFYLECNEGEFECEISALEPYQYLEESDYYRFKVEYKDSYYKELVHDYVAIKFTDTVTVIDFYDDDHDSDNDIVVIPA